MKFLKLKLLLVFLMLFQVQFSCTDKCGNLELHKEPYFSMQNMVFKYVDLYWINIKSKKIMWNIVSQDYENMVYPCDSLAMYFECPKDEMIFHSKNIINNFFGSQSVFADNCTSLQNGYAGTKDLIDKIYISSNYDFDETHNKNDNLSDIVGILAYTTNATNEGDKWVPLDEYNQNSPYEAPKRFHLIIKRKPTRSMKQQFVIKYYMKNEEGEASKYFIIHTPVFTVR